MTITARAAGHGRSCSPSIEQFAIRQNATPFPASSAFQGFRLSDAFRPEMLRAIWSGDSTVPMSAGSASSFRGCVPGGLSPANEHEAADGLEIRSTDAAER